MKKKRLLMLLVFFAAVASIIGFCFLSAADKSTPVLYRNDAKYSITEYPAEVEGGTIYVPASFFVGLNNVEYQFDKKNSSFYFRNKTTGRFFSFSFNASGIVVDNVFTSVVFPLMNSTVYLPLEYCADILSLKIEKSSEDGVLRVRLSDGSEKLRFKELVELYDPVEKPDDPTVINPVDPDSPTQIEVDRHMYVTIEADENSDVDKMLDTLRDWDRKATFFFSEKAIASNPKAVIRAFAENHSIGILSTPDNLKKTNRTLYDALGFCSRLLRLPEGVSLSDEDKESLSEKGYIVWGYTKKSDSQGSDLWTVAKDIYNSTFINDLTVLKLSCDEHNAKILNYIMSLISDDKYIDTRVIDPTTPEI